MGGTLGRRRPGRDRLLEEPLWVKDTMAGDAAPPRVADEGLSRTRAIPPSESEREWSAGANRRGVDTTIRAEGMPITRRGWHSPVIAGRRSESGPRKRGHRNGTISCSHPNSIPRLLKRSPRRIHMDRIRSMVFGRGARQSSHRGMADGERAARTHAPTGAGERRSRTAR